MGFILDSLANILVEALDTLILWICNLSVTFRLDIGETGSVFSTVFPDSVTGKVQRGGATVSIEDFATAIGALAVMLLLLATIFKIYQLMLNPHAKSEGPGEIVLKFVLSLTGIIMAYPIFKYLQSGFNMAYTAFTTPYEKITAVFKHKNFLALKEAEEISRAASEKNIVERATAAVKASNAKDTFLLGSDHLINPDDGIMEHPFALAIIEIFVGIALMMALIKLVFEIYERYVILAVLYLFSPLAFMSLITKGGEVFKSYWWMVFSQFILMCSNLVFLTIFMAAWYKVIENGANMKENTYFFKNSQHFVTTMLFLISWLVVGQEYDELLKGLGLSAATTGRGIMGAALGSVIVARAMLGGAEAAVGHTGKFLTGQTATQRALRDGTGLVGKIGKTAGGSIVKQIDKMRNAGMPKAYGGEDFKEALNNMVKGTEDRDGAPLSALGDKDSSARADFDANKLPWSDLKDENGNFTGIRQAHDPVTDNTYNMGITDKGNNLLLDKQGPKTCSDGVKYDNELSSIKYDGAGTKNNTRYVSVVSGNTVGKYNESLSRQNAPRGPKPSTSAGGSDE